MRQLHCLYIQGTVLYLKCWSQLDTLVSGSPVIPNGKLIGAITHVLVNDPTRGYAIFAETMLETAQGVAQNHLKEAA